MSYSEQECNTRSFWLGKRKTFSILVVPLYPTLSQMTDLKKIKNMNKEARDTRNAYLEKVQIFWPFADDTVSDITNPNKLQMSLF